MLPDYTQDDLSNVRLLACDMDLTLLADDKSMPQGIMDRIRALLDAGVWFCPASGRPGPTLQSMFPRFADTIPFIPDNGGYVLFRGQMVYRDLLDSKVYHDLLRAAVENGRGVPCIVGFDRTYVLESARAYEGDFKMYYPQLEYVASFDGVDPETNKITIFFPNWDSPVHYREFYGPKFADALSVTCAGDEWIDIMNDGVNKGTGLARLCEHLGIALADAAAVGDTYNDIEMLEAAGHSFLVANAEGHMEAHAKFRVPSNNDAGVIALIDAILAVKR